MRVLLRSALALSLAGCDLVSGPGRPDMNFIHEESPVDRETTVANIGVLLFTGGMPVPCQTYRARADVRVSGSDVDLTITAEPASSTCVENEFGFLIYEGTVGLGRGTYRVRVHHEWPQTNWPRETVLDATTRVGLTN